MGQFSNAKKLLKDINAIQSPQDLLETFADMEQDMALYESGIQEVRTKLEILQRDARFGAGHNPIESIKSRIKKPMSIIEKKDYIQNPKPNGYRSYHMILEVPVFLSDRKQPVRVEVQLRTIAMDFWASLEHQIHYKASREVPDCVVDELKECADIIAHTDERMQSLSKQIRCIRDTHEK